MRVLFTSIRNTSHFLPLVPFIEACRRRGAEVAVAAPKDLEDRVKPTGAMFFPFGHPGEEGLRPIWQKLRETPEAEAGALVVREIFAGVCARSAVPALLETMDRFRPSIVVRESQEYAGIIAAEKAGVPHAHVSITAGAVGTELFVVAREALDALRATVGLPADPDGTSFRNEPALTQFPASFEGPSESAARVLRFRSARREAAPLPDYWPGREGRFVYVTLGTVMGTMTDMQAAYGVVLDAVRDLPVRILLTIGNDLPMDALGTVPPNVHVERFVPQDDVIPHADAVVCHGGSGTTLGTLAAGVPLVVMPMFADQPHNAERVRAIGAGLALPKRGATAATIREALSRVLAEDTFRDVARRIAAEMAALPLVDAAADELERLAKIS